MAVIKILNQGTGILKGLYTIFNNTSFFVFSLFWIIFILFNSSFFSSTSLQADQLRNSIVFLVIFFLIVIAFIKNKTSFFKEVNETKGFMGLFSFLSSFILFGILFVSLEGQLNTDFVNGFLLDPQFLFTYMFIIAFLEEAIFRLGIIELFKTKTKNLLAIYTASAFIFAIYHTIKYNFDIGALIFAFFAGLGFIWIHRKGRFGSIPTFPVAVALHMVYNLYSVGALSIVLSMV